MDELPDLVAQCYEKNARAYLALSTIVLEDGLPLMHRNLGSASDAGVDAVIACNNAVPAACMEYGLESHLSTQASVSSSAAILEYHRRFGIIRFGIVRECTLERITNMQKNLATAFGGEDHPL